MTEARFTPGPWENAGTVIWSPAGTAVICEISELRPPSGTVEHRKFDVFREPDEARQEAFANAHLIAAAPGLYAALTEAALQIEYLHGKFQETGSGNAVLAKARAALARARGEQP